MYLQKKRPLQRLVNLYELSARVCINVLQISEMKWTIDPCVSVQTVDL